jgi:hypothetical protein
MYQRREREIFWHQGDALDMISRYEFFTPHEYFGTRTGAHMWISILA